MISVEKKYFKASQISEALNWAKEYNVNARFIAGGTDIMTNKQQENETSAVLIDISGINELKTISIDEQYLKIGALVTLSSIINNDLITNKIPALKCAAKSVGTPLIRKTATLGGNILCENRCLYYNQSAWWREAVGHCLKCNGDICIATGGKNACFSEFVSDTAPVLISLESLIRVVSIDGTSKTILLQDIYTGDGVKPRSLNQGDLVTEISIPLNQINKCVFNKLRLRESLEFTSLSSGVNLNNDGKIKITLAGMDPKPVYVETDKNEKIDDLTKRLLKLSRAVDNDVFTRKYRRDMVKVFITNSYKELNLL